MGFRHRHTNTQDTDGMRRRSRPHQMHNSATLTDMHNAIRQDLAPHSMRSPRPILSSRLTLLDMVASAVQRTRHSADGLTAKDHSHLSKLSDGFYLSGVLRFMEITQKCTDVADAAAFPEALRGFTVMHHPRAHVCLGEAFRAESYANGEFDAAQLAYAEDPTEQNRQWAIEAGTKQLMETHRSLVALHRHDGRLRLAAVR